MSENKATMNALEIESITDSVKGIKPTTIFVFQQTLLINRVAGIGTVATVGYNVSYW